MKLIPMRGLWEVQPHGRNPYGGIISYGDLRSMFLTLLLHHHSVTPTLNLDTEPPYEWNGPHAIESIVIISSAFTQTSLVALVATLTSNHYNMTNATHQGNASNALKLMQQRKQHNRQRKNEVEVP